MIPSLFAAPPAATYLSPITPAASSPLNTTPSTLSNTSSTSTSPGAIAQSATPKKKCGGGRKREGGGSGQQGGSPKKAKVSRYFLLAPGCTQDDYSKKGAKPGKPRKNDKHLPVDIRYDSVRAR